MLARSRAVYPWVFGGHVAQVSTLLSLKACDTQKSPLVLADPLPCPPYLSISRSCPFVLVTNSLSPTPTAASALALFFLPAGSSARASSYQAVSQLAISQISLFWAAGCCSKHLPPALLFTHEPPPPCFITHPQAAALALAPVRPPLPTLPLSPFFAARRQQL